MGARWIERIGGALDRAARRVLPDPFVLAIILTFVVLLLSLLFSDDEARRATLEKALGRPWEGGWLTRPTAAVAAWFAGLWKFLAFAMEMCLILVTGHAVASAPVVRRGLARLADIPQTPRHAVAFVAGFACLTGLLNWGLSLIVGASLAVLVAERTRARGVRVHYPLLGAAGYVGLMVWHGGLSGSAPLKVAVAGHELQQLTGVLSLDGTVLSGSNLLFSLALLVAVPAIMAFMHPGSPESVEPYAGQGNLPEEDPQESGLWIERHPLLTILVVALALAGLGLHFFARGVMRGLNLDTVNLIFIVAGLLLHWSPTRYARAIARGAAGTGGILIQFPLYAGIMGILGGTGLLGVAAKAMVSLGGRGALPILTFVSAGLVNLFVPSGGGQWLVQGPIVSAAATAVGATQEQAVMALAYGDEWTNMLQPFWALPLLAITGLTARQVIGYTATLMLLALPLYLGVLAFGY